MLEESIPIIQTAMTGGMFLTGVYWIVRTIKKEKRNEHNKNETIVSNVT
jgi:hypothetical protein